MLDAENQRITKFLKKFQKILLKKFAE